jgi:hypothetical protein
MRVQIRLVSLHLLDRGGTSESSLELRVEIQDGHRAFTWPAKESSATVDNDRRTLSIDEEIDTYDVRSPITKEFKILVTGTDKGSLGQEDYGSGCICFELGPSTIRLSKSATIDLKRPKMKTNGQVRVAMTALAVP